MQNGWVVVHRQLQEHWLWEEKPFSYGHAWVDLIMMANHTERKILIGKDVSIIEAGSVITSELKLADRWGWSKTKVRRFLTLLENDSMIVKKTDHKKTTIKLEKYVDFQKTETKKKPQKNHKKTTEKPQKNTNNNVNNDNNINNILIYSANPTLNDSIVNFIEYRKSIKKPMSDNAVKIMLTKLNKLSLDDNTQIEILNQSIMNGWTGIFPLSEDRRQKAVNKGPASQRTCETNRFNQFEQRTGLDYSSLENRLATNARADQEDRL